MPIGGEGGGGDGYGDGCGDGDGSCCSGSVADVGDNDKGDIIGDEEG